MFPTERQVYHRLRWDPRFDVRRCHVVITLRPSGTQRLAFLDLDVEVVPWHRIAEFWIDDELAWSRAQRIDRLDELAARAGDAAPPRSEPAAIEGTPAPRPAPELLRVATWNLLFDRHDAELLRSGERWQDALDRLGALALDVIALVEVTPAIWARIAAQPWVRAYATARGPLVPYGEALLSREPIRDAHVLELVRHRTALCATLASGLGIAVVHLTSDRSEDAALVRSAQLAAIAAHVRANPRDGWIIAGDFNAAPEEHAETVAALGAVDAWEAARPDEPGDTFDVARNPLAAAMTTSGTSRRLDRVLAIGLAPRTAQLVGVEPGPSGLPPSDHYGVLAELARTPADLRHAPTTLRTAVALVPPTEAWGAIQRVRCAADRGFGRWPPHVTLAHPFVDEAWLDRAAGVLRERVAAIARFDITLDDIGPIEPGSRTIAMHPDRQAARAIERLRAAIEPRPGDARPFRPHLTLARDVDPRSITPFAVSWRVDRVAILVERDGRFALAHELPLAGTTLDAPPAAPDTAPLVARIAAAVNAIDRDATVEPFGSIVYAPAHARDVDLLVVTDTPPAALAVALGFTAAGTLVRGTFDDRRVELLVAARSDERALAGPRDAAYLVQHLRDHGRYAAFLAAWPDVLRFVHARALGRNGLGYLGSFGWALLLAIPLCHDPVLCSARDVLAAWFAWLARLAPGSAIGFSDDVAGHAPLWLAAPSPPARNAARGLTAGTFAVLREEFRRATRGSFERACTDVCDEPPPGTVIAIEGAPETRGSYEGAFRGLLLDLEAIGLVVRPWGRFERCAIGWRHQVSVVDRVDEVRATIAQWLAEHVPGARVADSGGNHHRPREIT